MTLACLFDLYSSLNKICPIQKWNWTELIFIYFYAISKQKWIIFLLYVLLYSYEIIIQLCQTICVLFETIENKRKQRRTFQTAYRISNLFTFLREINYTALCNTSRWNVLKMKFQYFWKCIWQPCNALHFFNTRRQSLYIRGNVKDSKHRRTTATNVLGRN